MSFADAVRTVLSKYAVFSGRARRGEYWWFVLAYIIASFVLYIPILLGIIAESGALVVIGWLLIVALILALIVPSIAVAVRRLHDAGFSGWLYLISLVPCGGIVLLVLLALPSKPEGAKYDKVQGGGGYGGQGYGGQYG